MDCRRNASNRWATSTIGTPSRITPSTEGFGDISATSQSARLVVAFQMLLDLVILGVGINAFVSAARLGRKRQTAAEEAGRTG